ncbi:D-3-phosphoglycerate dehydrogenase [Umbelopsis sp. PMI_123]|nr:D-3-phosphoglycerate dehydrogenase [Umbelopsis sp. PMI_123]
MSKPSVLIAGCVHFALKELEALSKQNQVYHLPQVSRPEFFELCKSKYQGVKTVYRESTSAKYIGRFDEELINHLPQSVKFICSNAAGYDAIDIHAAAKRGIYVSNTPGAVDSATADTAMILLLNACRNITQSEKNLREGRWNAGIYMGTNPEGKKLGILGMGGIGKAIAQRAIGFEMQIQYHNRSRLSAEVEEKYHATYVDFETLLRTSDVISVSVPLSKETTHLLGVREFSMCKDGVIIVNTARGKVIDEAALVKALESGKVSAVGLDVFEEEPKIHPGLLTHPRATLLPHIGTNTFETELMMEQLTLKNTEASLNTDKLITPIPEHKQYFSS